MIASTSHCPFCQGEEISYSDRFDMENESIEVTCNECGKTYWEEYQLKFTGVTVPQDEGMVTIEKKSN